MSDKITNEREAKKQQERALELLSQVRKWVRENRRQGFPDAPETLISQHIADRYAAYQVWYFALRDAMHILDPGFDE